MVERINRWRGVHSSTLRGGQWCAFRVWSGLCGGAGANVWHSDEITPLNYRSDVTWRFQRGPLFFVLLDADDPRPVGVRVRDDVSGVHFSGASRRPKDLGSRETRPTGGRWGRWRERSGRPIFRRNGESTTRRNRSRENITYFADDRELLGWER